MQLAVVIVAGGAGTRMKSEVPKQFLPLGDVPILVHTVKRFLRYAPHMQAVLVLPADHRGAWEEAATAFLQPEESARVVLQDGGATRTLSVEAGLASLASRVIPAETLVAIHDGVRPLITTDVLDRAYQSARQYGASVSCVQVKSSMREQTAPGQSHPVDRDRYWHVQTPQTFLLSSIQSAFAQRTHDQFTDDASLYQTYIGEVAICEGSYDNLKVTTPEDLFVAEALLARQQEAETRPSL